jgi:hypothetical protein
VSARIRFYGGVGVIGSTKVLVEQDGWRGGEGEGHGGLSTAEGLASVPLLRVR